MDGQIHFMIFYQRKKAVLSLQALKKGDKLNMSDRNNEI